MPHDFYPYQHNNDFLLEDWIWFEVHVLTRNGQALYSPCEMYCFRRVWQAQWPVLFWVSLLSFHLQVAGFPLLTVVRLTEFCHWYFACFYLQEIYLHHATLVPEEQKGHGAGLVIWWLLHNRWLNGWENLTETDFYCTVSPDRKLPRRQPAMLIFLQCLETTKHYPQKQAMGTTMLILVRLQTVNSILYIMMLC